MTTNNSTYPSPATVVMTADAASPDGTISQVQFYNGATLLDTVTASPYAYTWSNVSAGSYTLTAIATDNSGMSTTSPAVNITVLNPVRRADFQPGGGHFYLRDLRHHHYQHRWGDHPLYHGRHHADRERRHGVQQRGEHHRHQHAAGHRLLERHGR